MDLRCVRENYWHTRWLRKKNRDKRKIKMCDWKYVGFYGIPKSHGLIACELILQFSCHGMPKQKESNFQTLPAMSGAVPCTASISASPLSPILPLEKEEKEKKPDQINQSITKNNSSFFSCQTRSSKCDNASAIANRNMYCHILLKYNRHISLAYVYCSNLKFVLQVTPSLFICWLQYPKLYTCDAFLPIYSLQSSKIVYKWCLSLAFFSVQQSKIVYNWHISLAFVNCRVISNCTQVTFFLLDLFTAVI